MIVEVSAVPIEVSAVRTEVSAVPTGGNAGKHPVMGVVDAVMIVVDAVMVDVVGSRREMTAGVVVAMDAGEVPAAAMAGEDNSWICLTSAAILAVD